ncbi:hypothetical protein Bca101_086694 [Brassica carinata]
MNSNSETPVSGDVPATKPNGKDAVSSAEPVKRVGQAGVSLATASSDDSKSKKQNGKAVVSSADPAKCAGQPGDYLPTAIYGDSKSKKSNGKAVVSSADPVKRARQHGVSLPIPQEGELRFRLIHFWEARNALTKVLFGLEMLLIDGQGTVIQGFISPNRIETYLPHMFAAKVCAEPDVTIAFTWNSVLSVLENSPVPFPEDRFRFYGYEEFEAVCDLRGDLYDYVGHVKLVNEQAFSDSLVLDEVEIASSRRILVHVQTHDGPVMKLYIWDKADAVFCEKFKALGKPPTVILVTTVNPKHFGVANRVNAEIVTKAETATIGELLSYMKQEGAKVAWFECTATIDDIVRDSAWYYISCGGCKTKATKGPTTLMCKRCGKTEIVGAAEYLTKLCVYDNNDHASFVLLGDDGRELTGMKASELVESYFEVITYRSAIQGIKTQPGWQDPSLTVTKVLPLKVPALEGNIDEDVEEEPADEKDGAADGTVERNSDGIESGETKRAKRG